MEATLPIQCTVALALVLAGTDRAAACISSGVCGARALGAETNSETKWKLGACLRHHLPAMFTCQSPEHRRGYLDRGRESAGKKKPSE